MGFFLASFGTTNQLIQLINALEEPISTLVYLVSVASIRPEELAFKWKDLVPETRNLWVVRAVNQGELHTPKYHRSNRPIRLTEADVARLLVLKERMKAGDEDWMFPNRVKTGKTMKPGPIWHETLLGRRVQPVADRLGLPHITWRLLRHWGGDADGGGTGSDQGSAGTPRSLPARYSSQVLRSCARRVGRRSG
jgi:hypothetical protein